MEATCETSLDMGNLTYTDSEGNEIEATDAQATLNTVFNSTFTDSDSATYTAILEGTCTGAECDTVMENLGIVGNPCTSNLSGKFELQD